MDRTLPERIACYVKQNEMPIKGILLKVILEADLKNNYISLLGPTGQNGLAELDRKTILHNAAASVTLGLMDYRPIEKCFTGKVFVQIMTSQEIKAAQDAYKFYKDFVSFYPEGYEQMLKTALETLSKVDTTGLKIEAQIVPDTIKILVK